MDISSIVASGMQAMRTKADSHASNLANAQTPGYKRLVARTTERPQGGVDLSVERDPSPGNVTYASEAPSQPNSADGRASAGHYLDESDGYVASADDSSNAEVGALNGTSTFTEGSNVDPATELIGIQESARTMEMLAGVYQRADQALGTMFDAFG